MKTQSITKFLLLFFVMATQMSFGQIYDNSFNYGAESIRLAPVPNSPEAQAFTKYGNTPVNMYTGSPNVQIPIYTHKGRELNLPISLTYDASGIKVEQLASQVGLGWNLNVGGRISRIVNGLPDDFHNTSYTSGPYYSLWDTTVNAGIQTYDDLPSSPSFPGSTGKQDLINYLYFLKKASDNEYDIQPDYFSFNALGNSDMFTIDVATKTPKSLDNPRLKIAITKAVGGASTPITKWVVTTDDGIKYTFEEEEITRDVNMNDIGEMSLYALKKEYTSSWLLTKIESANNKDVYEFTYTDLGFWGSNRTASSITGVTNAFTSPPDPIGLSNNMGYSNTEYTIKQKVLSTITHNGKRIVDIDLLAERWDMDVDSAIEKISIYKQDTSNPTADLHKSFTFNYDYFRTTTSPAPPYDANNTPNEILIRLKLDGIDIKDSNSTLAKAYAFEYNDPYEMASTTSKAQDYYGYYNGAGNTVLYPTYSDPRITTDGADRTPSFAFAKKGLLNKITYPTGGHTEFEYEANHEQEITSTGTNMTWENVASTSIAYPNPLPITSNYPNACNASFLIGDQTPETTTNVVFEVTQNQTDYKMIYNQTGTLPKGFNVEHIASIVKIASPSATLPWTDIYDNNCNAKTGVDVVWSYSIYDNGMNPLYPSGGTIKLDIGHYQLVLANPSSTLSNSLDVEEGEGVSFINYVYNDKAGIRVKSIKDYTDATTLAFHKTYDYPSGTVISNPKYTYTSTQYYLDSNQDAQTSTILHRLSYASGTDKPHIGYSKVNETVLDAINSASNGKTTHYFYTSHYGNYRTGVYTYRINGKETAKHYGVTYELGKSAGNTVYDKNDVKVSSAANGYYDKEYYSNSGVYLHTDESKNDLFPIPTLNPQGQWFISYVSYTKIPGLASVSFGSSGGVGLQIPQDCLNVYVDSGIASDLCNPGIARLLKQTSKAWGKAGGITASSSSQYYNAATDVVSQLTAYNYYDEDELIVLLPNKPPVLVPGNYLLKDTETTNSKGETLKQEFLYADHVSGGDGSLETANMLAIPLVTKIYKDGTLMSTKKTVYSGTLPDTLKVAKGTQNLEARLLFERFVDDNLVQVKQVNGSSTAYIWGYDKRYVIAKVENATYSQIEALNAFPSGFEENLNALSPTQETELRSMPNVLVTTYVYDPIVGVTSITDTKGNTINYEYDAFNRLEFVKDKDGNLLSENQYNYKN